MLNILANVLSSFVGSAFAVYIFPYIKECVKKGDMCFKEFEERLQKFDFICSDVILNMKKYSYDEDEINDYDISYYEEKYEALKRIYTEVFRDKYKTEKTLFGGYENIFEKYINGVRENFEKEQDDYKKLHENFEFEGGYNEWKELNHYYNQFAIQGELSSKLIRSINEMYNKNWITMIPKKIISFFWKSNC